MSHAHAHAPAAAAVPDALALARRSATHVGAHDRAAWLDLFSAEGVAEDPVGVPGAYRHDGSLAAFWDTFIAHAAVRFEVRDERLQGDDVIRDVIIRTELAPGVTVEVAAYVLYATRVLEGERRIDRLAAHWSLRRSKTRGAGAWKPMAAMLARMLRRLGPAWAAGYVAATWRGLGLPGVRLVRELARAVSARDTAGIDACFAPGAEVRWADRRVPASEWLALVPAGSTLTFDGAVAAGWAVACRFRLDGPAAVHGLALLEAAPGERRFRSARFFVDKPAT